MKTLLAIDTSTERATVALKVGDAVFYGEKQVVREHAMCLLPMIETMLADASCALNQLDGIAFGRGPGSFTGLRIACSIAKGLAYARDLPLFPVSSLAAIAHAAYQSYVVSSDKTPANTKVLAMLDARMQQLYWALFSHESDVPKEHVSAASDVDCAVDESLVIAGVGLEAYSSQWPSALQSLNPVPCLIYPDARVMIDMVRLGRVKAVSAADALPVYIREFR